MISKLMKYVITYWFKLFQILQIDGNGIDTHFNYYILRNVNLKSTPLVYL
jgi:hypothetical protein